MFFDNIPSPKTKRVQLAELPRTPETGWHSPRSYPNWHYAIGIGFDWEMKEYDFEHGPGWGRGKSHIVGGSLDLLFPDGSTHTEYRPIRHEVEQEYNLPAESTIRFWKDVLESNIPKFGANLIYDIGSATTENINVKGDLFDCQFAEALLTQDEPVSLEACAHRLLGLHKQTSILYEWLAKAYGGEPTAKQRENIFRASPRIVGPYGEQDAKLPRLVLLKQAPELYAQQLWDLFRMECELIPLWVRMRLDGCRVDLDKAAQMKDVLTGEITIKERAIFDLTGRWLNVLSADELAPAYSALGVECPMTPETKKASIRADWLADQVDPLSLLVLETRRFYKLRDTFIQSYILDAHVNRRIHGQFHPLRGEGARDESNGTVTGRLASSKPNLQNIPSRTALGKKIMSMYLPDVGDVCVESGDYSQIEYRAFMHYAIGPRSDEYRQKYVNDPKTDYHTMAVDAIKLETGIYIPRSSKEVVAAGGNLPTGRLTIKEVNFGKLFGVGKDKMAAMAHCPVPQATRVLDALAIVFPFIKPSQDQFSNEAKTLGYITTVLNRRYRFDLWEAIPVWNDKLKKFSRSVALSYHHALQQYGQIQRAGTHRAMAARCQGTGTGDVIKHALWVCLKSGIFDIIGYPKLSVHDQVLRSVHDYSPEQEHYGKVYHWQMENSLQLRVPKLFEIGRGPNWGSIE